MTNPTIPPPPAGFNVIPPPPAGFEMQSGEPAPQATTQSPPANAPPPALPDAQQDPGFVHGLWESTFKPVFDEAKKQRDDVANAPDFASKLELTLGNALKSTAPAMATKMVAGIIQQAYEQGKKSVQHVGNALGEGLEEGKSLVQGNFRDAAAHGAAYGGEMSQASGHALAAAVPVVGPAAAKAGEDIGAGKTREGMGEAAGTIGQALLPSLLPKSIRGTPAAFHEAEAAERLTNAVNPSAVDMPKFSASLTKQIGRIADYAEENKMPLQTREDLLNAAEGAKKVQSEHFYEKMLNPIKDEMVGTSEVKGYQGDTLGEGRNVASIGQLDKRLTEINATLHPSYAKGGSAGQAAVSAESKASLTAEAATLRKVLYERMGEKLNLDPKAIAEVRSSIGELDHIADRTEFALNQEKHAANAAEREPLTINPFHQAKGRFIGDAAINKAANMVRGNPADNAVRDVFENLEVNKPTNPKPGQKQPKFQRPENNTSSPSMSVGSRPGRATIGEMIEQKGTQQAEAAKANDARIAANKAAREATKKAAEEVQQKNRATHGRWKGAKALGENE